MTAAQAIKDSQWDKGTTTTTTKAVLPPEPYDPEDTNDEFCFQCGSGGDLSSSATSAIGARLQIAARGLPASRATSPCPRLVCRPRARPPTLTLASLIFFFLPLSPFCTHSSYHMYCLPEPLEEAPEGEWACPAHRPGQRGKKKTETEMLELDKNKGTDPGMRHKPPRLDSKYQIMPEPQLTDEAKQKEVKAKLGEAAARKAWVVQKVDEGDLLELLAFTHRLIGSDIGSEERFNEHLMSHYHLSKYQLPVAQSHLLRASRCLGGLPDGESKKLRALGYSEGEMVMSLLGRAHDDEALLRNIAPGIDTLLDSGKGFELSSIAGGESASAAASSVAAYEDKLAAAVSSAVTKWEAELSSALNKPTVSLEDLKSLVESGAVAHQVNIKYLANGGRTQRLSELRTSLKASTAWSDKCDQLLAKPTGPEVLDELLADGDGIPMVKLTRWPTCARDWRR